MFKRVFWELWLYKSSLIDKLSLKIIYLLKYRFVFSYYLNQL